MSNLGPHCVIKKHMIFNKSMRSFDKRLETFQNWTNSQSCRELANCGFYYLGANDKVTCSYCGIGLHEWQKDDNPWIEHALYSNKCLFLLLNKSQAKIQPSSIVVENTTSTVSFTSIMIGLIISIIILYLCVLTVPFTRY